jgi:hypothetical protein
LCETLRHPHLIDNRLTDGGEVISLTRRPPFTPQKESWYSFLLEAESTIVRLEELGQLKKPDLVGNRTRDLPACCMVPQPTTLPRAQCNICRKEMCICKNRRKRFMENRKERT